MLAQLFVHKCCDDLVALHQQLDTGRLVDAPEADLPLLRGHLEELVERHAHSQAPFVGRLPKAKDSSSWLRSRAAVNVRRRPLRPSRESL